MVASTRAGDDPKGVAFFETKIRPVLVEKCHECHSSQAKKPKGGLKVDSPGCHSQPRRDVGAGRCAWRPGSPACSIRQSPRPTGSSRCLPKVSSPRRSSPTSASGSPWARPTLVREQRPNRRFPLRPPKAAIGGRSSRSQMPRFQPSVHQSRPGPRTRSTPSFLPGSRKRTFSRRPRPTAAHWPAACRLICSACH